MSEANILLTYLTSKPNKQRLISRWIHAWMGEG